MNSFFKTSVLLGVFIGVVGLTSFDDQEQKRITVLADIKALSKAGIPVFMENKDLGLGYAKVTPYMENVLSRISHMERKCGGYEVIHSDSIPSLASELSKLEQRINLDYSFARSLSETSLVNSNSDIEKAISEVSEAELKNWVQWLSGFPERYFRSSQPNKHVEPLQQKLQQLLAKSALQTRVDLITHANILQKSIRVRIEGKSRPDEIVVLGAHLDSINQSFFNDKSAPGADDNASGSANLLEALRILLKQNQPERSIEIFWYAGEEGGLLGSSEIAQNYKKEGQKVISVMQLDMTLFPGNGELSIGNVTDFTSPWLQKYFKDINEVYLHLPISDFKCGYACSDHASWYRAGYPTFFPFEATFDNHNQNIHTTADVIDSQSSFKHSAVFSKFAIIYAMDMANSTLMQPY